MKPFLIKPIKTITAALLFMMIGASSSGFSQTESTCYDQIAGQLQTLYNNGQYEAIFELFSKEMQLALPFEASTKFFSQVKEEYGELVNLKYQRNKEPFKIYKATFKKGVLALNIALDDLNKINGFALEQFTDQNLPIIERNITGLSLPFSNEWYVVWGGDTKEQNYHLVNQAQKNAFDFFIIDRKGKSYRTDGKRNEDYYAFNQPILSPCDAKVVMTVDGIKDNVPGNLNPYYAPGNTVILQTVNGEFLVLGHFKQYSIAVKEGDKIARGKRLGYCGNSGNSSEPHLHFHMQNVEDMNAATGIKAYFDKIYVNHELKHDYSPVKGDYVCDDPVK